VGNGRKVKVKTEQKDDSLFNFSKLKELTTNSLANGKKIYQELSSDNGESKLINPISSGIDSHQDDKRLLYDPYYKDNHYNSTCSETLTLYMSSLIRNQTKFKFDAFFDSENFNAQKNGLYFESYQLWLCKNNKGKNYADLYIRGIWKNKTMHT
jgi:hypothetical protein